METITNKKKQQNHIRSGGAMEKTTNTKRSSVKKKYNALINDHCDILTSKTTLDVKVIRCGGTQVDDPSIKVFHHDCRPPDLATGSRQTKI